MVERKRHLAKAITYRVCGSTVTAGVGYALSGSVEIGAALGVADTVVKIVLYYAHERLWYRIKWGVHEGVPDRSDQPRSGQAGSGQAGFDPQVQVRPVELLPPGGERGEADAANAAARDVRELPAA